jgi:hypothetical protein
MTFLFTSNRRSVLISYMKRDPLTEEYEVLLWFANRFGCGSFVTNAINRLDVAGVAVEISLSCIASRARSLAALIYRLLLVQAIGVLLLPLGWVLASIDPLGEDPL